VIAVTGDRIVFANPAAARLTQTPVEALVGASLDERLPAADRERIRALIADAIASSEPRGPVELRLRSSGPDLVELELVALGVQLAGEPTGLVILHDVSERVRMREQLLRSDRLASLGTLVAGIGHEINNPLTYVMGNLEVLAETFGQAQPEVAIPRAEIQSLLEEAYDGGKRIRTIVREMREFARPNVADVADLDLQDVVGDALKLMRHTLAHQARLISELAPATTRGNRARLGQVIVNLLVNAVQASRGGASTAEIRVVTRVVGGEARVEVHDNGVGMSHEVTPAAFDPFFTTKPVGSGTGLGLSVCHGIATAYGGRIELDSIEHEGTVASLVMPAILQATVPAPAIAPALPARAVVSGTDTRRARVLIIDDDDHVVRALKRMLREHDVDTATNLAEIEARLHRGPFDLVLCDLMMPDITGMDLYARIAMRRRPRRRWCS